MARATRSGTKLDSDTLTDTQSNDVTALPPGKHKSIGGQGKKRKRNSNAENEDQPVAKQLRSATPIKDDDAVKDDVAQEKPLEVKGAGDVPILPEDAQRILDILEMVDTQGLLDRVFPLPADPAATLDPQSSSQPNTYSFRTLLQESQRHPLRVLKSAVQPLLPVFTQPRSRPSSPAAQQLKFCTLALSLLDQCSFHSSPASFDVESLLAEQPDAHQPDSEDTKSTAASRPSAAIPRKRKYALMQKLPTGEWWSSLDTELTFTDGKEIKDLPTAQAELVAILPSASSSSAVSSSVPTLGSYTRRKIAKRPLDVSARKVGTGAFLDYGPFASFAPTFDQDSAEVGRVRLGEVLWEEEKKRRLEKLRKAIMKPKAVAEIETEDTGKEVEDATEEAGKPRVKELRAAAEETLHSLLPPEEVESIKAALGTLELEQSVQELLDRNAKALARLEELQRRRLASGTTKVEVGSEEWDVAQGITNSLSILASLRPRSADNTRPSLIPSASALRQLHCTLPVGPSEGWYGTLQSNRPTTALRDDSTIRIKSGHIPVAATAAPPIAIPATQPNTTTPATPTAAPNYAAAYAYPGYGNAQYRPGGYNYAPASTNAYFPNAYGQSATTAAAGTSGAAATPTQQPQYPAGANPYAYTTSWYNYTHQQQQQQASQPATPQTGQGATPSYAAFFNSQPQRAVANTLATPSAAATKGYVPAWAPAAGSALPSHLRAGSAAAAGNGNGTGTAPGTPTAAAAQYAGYYATYQQTQTPTQAGQR